VILKASAIIKNKIRKLLALSKSDNENEAAIALEKANKLMEEYALDENEIKFESIGIKSTKTYCLWRFVIANAVTWLYGCYSYRDQDKGERVFIGESLDVFMASEMYSYLIKTIERCAKKNIRKNAKHKFRQSFKLGMARSLYSRIHLHGDACSWSPRRNEKIEESRKYAECSVQLVDSKPKKSNTNLTALTRGSLFGEGVSLARQTEHTQKFNDFLKQGVNYEYNKR